MIAWVNKVALMRKELDRANMVEELVYCMLGEEPELRIRAAQIVTAFESHRADTGLV